MMKFALVSAVLLSLACSTSAKKSTAKAVHILMKEEDEIKKVQEEIEGGGDFAKLAEKHSTCPSGKKGGDLGSFSPGAMVKEFDTVVFDPKTELGKVYGPVKTQFGFHLIKVVERDGKTAGGSDEKKKKKKKKIPAMESVKTAAQFKDILAHKDAYALEFYSSMCGSCKEFSPVWDKYAKAGPPVRTAKVNIDDAGGMELAQTLGVMEEGIPNVRVFTGADEQGVSIMKGDPLSMDALKKAIDAAVKDLGKKSKKTGVVKKAKAE